MALAFGFAVETLYLAQASAQDSTQAEASDAGAPMPPVRPSTLPKPVPQVVPVTPPEPGSAPNDPPPWTPGKLLQLPPYTRARMHECALEWQKMKAEGEATEKIWFNFAQSCLSGRS
ncbi:MAG TPA: hypothetical protein VKV77_04930 [Methylovirgula sp.]|nr:hypothetical protein [Methylovirgula sp.]